MSLTKKVIQTMQIGCSSYTVFLGFHRIIVFKAATFTASPN